MNRHIYLTRVVYIFFLSKRSKISEGGIELLLFCHDAMGFVSDEGDQSLEY